MYQAIIITNDGARIRGPLFVELEQAQDYADSEESRGAELVSIILTDQIGESDNDSGTSEQNSRDDSCRR